MPNRSKHSAETTAVAPYVIALACGHVRAFNAEAALDLVEAAHRRGLTGKTKHLTKVHGTDPAVASAEETPSATMTITAWEEFYGRISEPSRMTQLYLLHLLRNSTEKGYVNRAALSAALGYDGHNGSLSLGGVCKALVKNARACGLDPHHVIEHSSLGYRAGRLVRSNRLPPLPTSKVPEPSEDAPM